MADIVSNLFGPLNKEYCLYFYFLSILGFLFMFVIIISFIFIALKTKKLEHSFVVSSLSLASLYFILYFQNRILYSMCSGLMK